MSQITLKPIGYVRNQIRKPKEDYWGGVPSVIEMDAEQFGADALRGLDEFSHIEVLFHLCGVEVDFVVTGAAPPGQSGLATHWNLCAAREVTT